MNEMSSDKINQKERFQQIDDELIKQTFLISEDETPKLKNKYYRNLNVVWQVIPVSIGKWCLQPLRYSLLY